MMRSALNRLRPVVERPWSLRSRITALCVLVVVLIGLLAAGAVSTAASGRDQLDRLLNEIGPMRTADNDLVQSVLDQETGLRGYVLRGHDDDLTPYTNGVAVQRTATEAITASPAAGDRVRTQLATVTAQVESWRHDIAEPSIAMVRTQGPEAARAFLGQLPPERFNQIRAEMDQLQILIEDIRDDAASAVRDTNSSLMSLLIVAAAVVLISGVALLVLLQRLVIRPVSGLAAQVRAVSRGDYAHRISADGPPELTRLARDVDSMRERIADDLAEVQAARIMVEQVAERLESQAAELARSNRDLEQFAYVASHDLQEPLRKVASFCQLLQRRYAGQLDERADQYIAFAVNGAQRMQRLINDLLAFSRIGRSSGGFGEVDLAELMPEVAAQLESTRRRAKGTITWDDDLPTVRGEQPLLETLLVNLVSNSLKFRKPKVAPHAHVSAQRLPSADGLSERWEISCTDNGIGIEREYADRVFVIFQRLHPKDAYPGTGIGLAIAKKIVEYHGGQIWVDAGADAGTTIRFTLPVGAEPVQIAELDPSAEEEFARRAETKEAVA
jgi:signal transduction histidine kinase